MTEEELREMLRQLEQQGWQPQLCDTPVPYYDTPVACGDPKEVFSTPSEKMMLPRDMLSMHPEFTVMVKGDSMKDAGIVPGDIVKVVSGMTPRDGDIVLTTIDGVSTLKVYYEDDGGHPWLIPQNEAFEPISLEDKVNVCIWGCVRELIKQTPRVSSRVCKRALASVQQRKEQELVISDDDVRGAIATLAPRVTAARQWFAVYRGMADLDAVAENDFEGFCRLVCEVVPGHKFLPKYDYLQRMNTMSFTRHVERWQEDNAPVTGKRFYAYKQLGQQTKALLRGEKLVRR